MPPRRAASGGAAAALMAVLLACAPRATITTRTIVRTPAPTSTWMGRPTEEVERAWGDAPLREPDGEGGNVLVYRKDTGVSVSASSGPERRPTDARSPADSPDSQRSQTERLTKVLARFWVDRDGKVYRYWFAQEIYDAGKDAPPLPPGD